MASFIPITDLANGLTLKFPVYVKVEAHENLSIAFCPTLGRSAHGEDYNSALDELKRCLAEDYEDYKNRYPNLSESNLSILKVWSALLGEELPITRDMIAEILREELTKEPQPI